MTGVEAVSNGVPAFTPPEAKNAAATLVIMAVLSSRCSWASRCWRTPTSVVPERRTRPWCRSWPAASSAAAAFLYYCVQAATMLILVLAANTAYADFPRLASILARDRYPAAAVHEPGRPAGVLERHRRS